MPPRTGTWTNWAEKLIYTKAYSLNKNTLWLHTTGLQTYKFTILNIQIYWLTWLLKQLSIIPFLHSIPLFQVVQTVRRRMHHTLNCNPGQVINSVAEILIGFRENDSNNAPFPKSLCCLISPKCHFVKPFLQQLFCMWTRFRGKVIRNKRYIIDSPVRKCC